MTDTISFFECAANVRLGELAQSIGCELGGTCDPQTQITSAGPIEAAEPGSITFIDNPKYASSLKSTRAAAVICASKYADQVPENVATLISPQPYKAFATAMGKLFPTAMRPQPVVGSGVSDAAYIDATAVIEDDVTIEPGAVIGPDVCIGKGSLVGPNVVIGAKVQVGRNTSICAGATIVNALIGNDVIIHPGVRIGNDGFGFAMGPGGHQKIPQIGRVIIQDQVEIGSNTSVDRGSNRDTIIGEGTKIDNLVMIGHNVVIGCHCVIVAQTGIAGSAELGDYVVVGGQAGINGHVKIGSGAQLAGLSGVSGDVPPGAVWGGVPARPIKHWMRDIARSRREAFAMENRNKKEK